MKEVRPWKARTDRQEPEVIKCKAFLAAPRKNCDMLFVETFIQNIDLSHELETASKPRWSGAGSPKAKFTQQKAQIEADTVMIKAKGDAESIRIRAKHQTDACVH